MGQALSNFATKICIDTGLDEFEIPTRPSRTHIFPQRPGPQLIQTPLRWSRGSDSFTHPVTNSVRKRIVRSPPPVSNAAGDSTSWTQEVSQLGLGLGLLVTRDESDSVRQLGRDPALRWSRGSDSFTLSGTNSVRNRIVWNPPPGSDSDGDSSSQTREVSQLGHGHLVTRDLSDSVCQLGRDPVISSPKWLEEFLGESSITVGANTIEVSEVLKEVRERDEERDLSNPKPNSRITPKPTKFSQVRLGHPLCSGPSTRLRSISRLNFPEF